MLGHKYNHTLGVFQLNRIQTAFQSPILQNNDASPLLQELAYRFLNSQEMAFAKGRGQPLRNTSLRSLALKRPLEISEITDLLDSSTEEYIRTIPIEARLAKIEDCKTSLITYISDGNGGVIQETSKAITDIKQGLIIARNPNPLPNKQGETIYNAWPIYQETWQKNYIGAPTAKWQKFSRKSAMHKKGIIITAEILKLLGNSDGNKACFEAPWGGPMWAVKDGLLTDEGYTIAPEVIAEYYGKITSPASKQYTAETR